MLPGGDLGFRVMGWPLFRSLVLSEVGPSSPNKRLPTSSGSVESLLGFLLASVLHEKYHEKPLVELRGGQCIPPTKYSH